MTIFEQIKTLGIEYDSHCSDLYFPKTAETTKIIESYEFKNNVTTFKDNTTGAIWYDVPFAYDSYWNKKG